MSAQALRVEEQAVPYLVAPQLTDHLDTFVSAPEGFKRLRELVLNLAVRGRLVPQVPGDEPAEKLLERIRSTNNRVASASVDSEPYALPSSWVWTTLGEISNIGETIKAGVLQNDVWVLDLEDIEKDTSKVTRKVRFSERQSKSDKNAFSAGDVLYGKLRPYLNKVIVADEPGVCTTEILPLRGYESIDANYIKTFLKSPGFIDYVNAKSYGMKMPRLGTIDAKRAYFALPPLPEQSRIVAKVEELMALIDRLEAKAGEGEATRSKLLDTLLDALADSPDADATADAWEQLVPHFDLLLQTPADVDRLQQTLLQLAVKGRLVPQDPKDEPAAELLKRIRAERDRLIAEGRIKPATVPVTATEPSSLYLPATWSLVRLSDLLPDFQNGVSSRGCTSGESIVVLRLADIDGVEISLANPRELVLEAGMKEKYALTSGDVLIVRVNGSAEIVGKFVLCRSSLPVAYCDHFIRMRIRQDWISPDYLGLVGMSRLVRDKISDLFITTAGQKTVNQGHIGSLLLPLPPLPEQSRIVAAVAFLTTLCDRLRERLAARRELSAKLTAVLTESALG